MLRYIAEENLPYRITLVYSNRDLESTAFLDELKELEQRIDGLTMILTMTDDETWEGDTRRIDADFIREQVGDFGACTYLVSGPPDMVNSVGDSLEAAGVPEEQVLRSRFAGY